MNRKWKHLASSVVTLPWRPLYNTLLATHSHSLRQPVHHSAAIETYQVSTLIALAKKARRYPCASPCPFSFVPPTVAVVPPCSRLPMGAILQILSCRGHPRDC